MNERESICADIIDEGLVAIVRVPRTELALPLARHWWPEAFARWN